jgi:hypothetical protein
LQNEVDPGLLLPVLQQGQIRGGSTHRRPELVEGQPPLLSMMAKTTPQDQRIQLLMSFGHIDPPSKDWQIFLRFDLQL